MSVNSQQNTTKQTPTAVHSRHHLLGNETIQQSPLGMLAALASPSPRVPVTKQAEISSSESPPTSPSMMVAARRQQKKQQVEDMEVNAAARQLVRSSNQSANVTPTRSPAVGTDDSKLLPSVSQLDVLALVTATSPPMQDNQQWTTATTPKPMNTAGKFGGTGSDTESETEEQLRSHSARMKSRRRTPQVIRTLRDRNTGHASAGRNGSSESTETDDDQRIRPLFVHRRPVGGGGALSFYSKRLPAPPVGPLFYPSSAPSLNRRQPRRYIRGAGVALSNQLAQLVEENDDDDKSSESSLSLSLSPPPYTSQQRIESKKRKLKQDGSNETTETESAHSASHRRRKLHIGAADEDSDNGEKTETDDEFFGPSRLAIHGSIRPSRRVARRLEGLQSRYPQPAALNFSRYQQQQQQQQQQPQAQTAPNSSGASNAGFGLGINGDGGSNGMPGARILSTPSSMARLGMVSAVRRERPPLPPPPGGPAARTRENRTNSLYNSSMGREFGRDPFAPTAVPAPVAIPTTITSRDAAMRRLEKPRQGGEKKRARARARALTAPSSLEPPMGKRPRTNRTSFEESSVDGSPPISSLRSSLFAISTPVDLVNSQEPSSSSTVTLRDQNSSSTTSSSGKDNSGGILFPAI